MPHTDTTYKLHYFNVRSRGDGIRFLFHYAGVNFEDNRISFDLWKTGDHSGLTGNNEFEAAECDEIADAFEELFRVAMSAEYSNDEKFKVTQRERLEKDYPRVLGHLESRLKANGSKHMVGSDLTWIDIAVAWYLRALRDYAAPLAHLIDSDYPTLAGLAKSVEAIPAIASYISKRPESKY